MKRSIPAPYRFAKVDGRMERRKFSNGAPKGLPGAVEKAAKPEKQKNIKKVASMMLKSTRKLSGSSRSSVDQTVFSFDFELEQDFVTELPLSVAAGWLGVERRPEGTGEPKSDIGRRKSVLTAWKRLTKNPERDAKKAATDSDEQDGECGDRGLRALLSTNFKEIVGAEEEDLYRGWGPDSSPGLLKKTWTSLKKITRTLTRCHCPVRVFPWQRLRDGVELEWDFDFELDPNMEDSFQGQARVLVCKELGQNEEILLDDWFPCLSRNKQTFRLILTPSTLLLHSSKKGKTEQYKVQDIFGAQTFRHKDQDLGDDYSSAYICLYTYPQKKQRAVMAMKVVREKTVLVFEVKKKGNKYEDNLVIATLWKTHVLQLISQHFPTWRLKGNLNTPTLSGLDGSGDGAVLSNDSIDADGYASQIPSLRFMRRYLVILNPISGQGKTREIFADTVIPIFKEAGIWVQLCITEHSGHARSFATSANLSEIDGIITVGGDGILYEVVNGLRSRRDSERVSQIPVGVIATGSGNGLARSVAEYSGEADDYLRDPVTSTALAAARGKMVQVNLAEVTLDQDRIFSFLSVGWGLVADIDVESEFLRLLGEARFTLWSFYRLINLKKYSGTLSYIPIVSEAKENGNIMERPQIRIIKDEYVCVYSSYQAYIGSDLIFAPDSHANDKVIHLVFMPGHLGRARATQFLISIDKGTHLDVAGVEYVKVKEFTLENKDGIKGNLTVDGEKVDGKKINVKLSKTPLKLFSL